MNKRLIGAIGIVLILLSGIVIAKEDTPITFTVGDEGTKFTVKNVGTDPIYVLGTLSVIDSKKNVVVRTVQDFPDNTVLKIYPGKSYSWELNDELDVGSYKGKIYWGKDKSTLTATYTEEFTVGDKNGERIVFPTITVPRPTYTWPRPTIATPAPTATTPGPTGRVQVTFYTDKRLYNIGEGVELTMRNIGTATVYVHVPNQLEDPWTVKKIGLGGIIHINTGCESGYGYGSSCDYVTLDPGEEISHVWDQKNDNGVQVSSGTYKAYAKYTKYNPDTVTNPSMVTKTTTFTIRR